MQLERMGCRWLDVIFELEGVVMEDDTRLERQAWLTPAEEEGKSSPRRRRCSGDEGRPHRLQGALLVSGPLGDPAPDFAQGGTRSDARKVGLLLLLYSTIACLDRVANATLNCSILGYLYLA